LIPILRYFKSVSQIQEKLMSENVNKLMKLWQEL